MCYHVLDLLIHKVVHLIIFFVILLQKRRLVILLGVWGIKVHIICVRIISVWNGHATYLFKLIVAQQQWFKA
jgi:hypothetical protein